MTGHELNLPDDIDVHPIDATHQCVSIRVAATNFKTENATVGLASEEQLIHLCRIIDSTDPKDDDVPVVLETNVALTPDDPATLMHVPRGIWYLVFFVKQADFTMQTIK